MATPPPDVRRQEVAPRFSEAVTHAGVVYLAGQVPERAGGEPIAAQTADVLALIDARLRAAGSDRSRLLAATVHLTDLRRDIAGMNAVWDAWLPAGCAPARTCVGVAALARDEWAVEITVVAAVAPHAPADGAGNAAAPHGAAAVAPA